MDLWRLLAIPREELGKGTSVRVAVGGDAEALARSMAEETARLIRDGWDAGPPVCAIAPVGRVGGYEPLARIIAAEGLDCSQVTRPRYASSSSACPAPSAPT